MSGVERREREGEVRGNSPVSSGWARQAGADLFRGQEQLLSQRQSCGDLA